MLRLIAVALAALLLSGCMMPNHVEDNELKREHFSVICLEGVSYWVRVSYMSYTAPNYIAPRYDASTLQPVRCSE